MSAILQFLASVDGAAFHGINLLAGRSTVLDLLARLGADDHIIPVTLALATLFVLLPAKGRRERERSFDCVIGAIAAALLGTGVLYLLNSLFFRPRPFTSRAVNLLFYHNTDSAFPSNAATLAFVLAFAVIFYNRKLGAVMLGYALAYQASYGLPVLVFIDRFAHVMFNIIRIYLISFWFYNKF